MGRQSGQGIVYSAIDVKEWAAEIPSVDAVRPGCCSRCGAASRPSGAGVVLVGHGARDRQIRGPVGPQGHPYGVYDLAANDGFVSVGVDHDTPVFAVTSIGAWWAQVGSKRYPKAREIFINADAGGSNSYRSHVWKHQLQRLADKLGMSIHVSHFPPGTSKWNKVEHRLFSFISINWRGRPCGLTRPSSA